MSDEKEKANELGNKFYEGEVFDKTKEEHLLECERAKKRAILLVDEILLNIEATITYHKESFALPINKEYWLGVRNEINLL